MIKENETYESNCHWSKRKDGTAHHTVSRKKNDLTLAAAIAPKGRDYIGEDLVIIPCVPVIF